MNTKRQPQFKVIAIVMILAGLIFGLGQLPSAHAQTYAIQRDPTIALMISQVNQNILRKYVGNLTGVNPVTIGGIKYTLRTRNTRSGIPVQKATYYVYQYMRGLTGLDSVTYKSWRIDGIANRNVVGVLTGTKRPKEIILLTAHLDDMPGGSVAPGADDNASGSAALMMAAKILSRYQFQRTVRFIFFTGEEQDGLGSWVYARDARRAGENIVAVVNMDMLAWDSKGGPTMRVHTRVPSKGAKDLEIANAFVDVVDIYNITLTPIVTSYGMNESDHGSFWAYSYPAVCIIEDDGDPNSWGDFNPNYHTTRDKLATLNIPYYKNMVSAIVGTVAHLSYLDKSILTPTPVP